MSADALLSRLQKVKQTGPNRWVGCCPAHDDKRPSLAIRELENSLILLHCFAQCSVEDVLAAVGLDWNAIMPPKAVGDHVKPERKPFFPADVFDVALKEIMIAAVIASDMHNNRTVSEGDYDRLCRVVERLNEIGRAAYGR